MRYIALWAGVVAALSLVGIALFGLAQLLQAIATNPELHWLAWIVGAIVCIATIAAVVDYWSDHKPKEPEL